MGTLHEIKNRDVSQQTAKFAVLDGVQDAVMVINSQVRKKREFFHLFFIELFIF